MSGETKTQEPVNEAIGLETNVDNGLGEKLSSGKDGNYGIPSESTSSTSSTVDATSTIKNGTAQALPISCYNYHYPGNNGSVPQFEGDGSLHMNTSPKGYLERPVSYGSEALPCYSWDSTLLDLSNGKTSSSRNTNHSPDSTATARLNGSPTMKARRNYSNSIPQTRHARPINKLPHLASHSSDHQKGQHLVGKYSAFANQRQGILPSNGSANYRSSNGRGWNGNDRFKLGDNSNRRVEFENSEELVHGPRSTNKYAPSESSAENKEMCFAVRRDQYNQSDFQTEYGDAKFYVIKSYSEDDVHKSIKYEVWASTPNGNRKLNAAFHDAEAKATETGTKCPIFLFFSVNRSGQFVGIAEMIGQVDFNKDMDFWQADKWNGFFPVKWHVIKDVPNTQLRHIILENNDNKSVTFTRDTHEIGLKQGVEMLKIFKSYMAMTTLLDDFGYYESREKSLQAKRSSRKNVTTQKETYDSDDFSLRQYGDAREMRTEVEITGGTTNTSCNYASASLVNRTRNLSRKDSPIRSWAAMKPSVNLTPARST